MNKEFILAVEELEKEKDISKDLLIDAIESALVSAYKRIMAIHRMSESISTESAETSTYI